jgi:hypothetical protein
MTNVFRGVPLAAALCLVACGDLTTASGELGRLEYALSTDYDAEARSLSGNVGLITNHPVELQVDLTEDGEEQAGTRAEAIRHEASAGVLEARPGDDDEPADLSLTVPDEGPVTVTSTLEGELFDRIELRFARPAELELVTWVRAPWEEDWTDTTGTGRLTVQEGGQISFLTIPVEADGNRILGDFTPEITLDPPNLAVPDESVLGVYEQNIVASSAPVTFYAVEPGDLRFTLTDGGNDVSVAIDVTIVPLAP